MWGLNSRPCVCKVRDSHFLKLERVQQDRASFWMGVLDSGLVGVWIKTFFLFLAKVLCHRKGHHFIRAPFLTYRRQSQCIFSTKDYTNTLHLFFPENDTTGFDDTMSPGEMHSALTSHTEVKVGCMSHLICVSRFLYPVANWVAVHSIHNVAVIITTASIMAWTAAWRWRGGDIFSEGWWTKHTTQCFKSNLK